MLPESGFRLLITYTHSYDTKPSSFERELHDSTSPNPSPKRTKLDVSPEHTSIAQKIKTGAYNAVDDLVGDLDLVTSSVIQDLQESVKRGDVPGSIMEHERDNITALKKRLNSLIADEMIQRPRVLKLQDSALAEGQSPDVRRPTKASHDNERAILTLCGGERSAKQLFSSLAKPGARNATLAEQPLPNGITTTNIIPVHSIDEGKAKLATMGDRFPSSSKLKAMSPPKPTSKHTSTRSSSVSWHNPAEISTIPKEPNSRDTYIRQPLSTGRWLTYNVAPSSEQLTSPKSKQKHRDRALSTGEPQSTVPVGIDAMQKQAKEDALFRSVYSSFAPNHDDAGAIVTEQQKNWLWWSKHGELQYQELLEAREDASRDLDADEQEDATARQDIDESLVEEAISNWESFGGSDMIVSDQDTNQQHDPQGLEDILQEISELLETLNSHQRIRNLSSSRGLPGQKESLATMPTSPSSPSFAEMDVYDSLRSRIVDIIATLPPYMLAKLDGDKLGALTLSTKIKVPGKNQKGMLEEEGLTAKSKTSTSTAYPAGYTGTSTLRGAYPSSSNTQQYPPRQGYGQTPAQRQAPTTNSYAASQYSNRPATMSQYPGAGARTSFGNQYPQQRTASSFVERFTNGQYGQQQSTPSYSQYGGSYRPGMPQQAGSYGQQYSTPQARLPPGSNTATQAYRGNQSEFQQRASGSALYGYNPAQGGANTSPSVPQGSSLPGQAAVSSQQRPQLHQQHSSQYGSRSPVEPQTNGINVNGQGQMSPVDQTTLIEKQKSQLAEQQARQNSDTPQPTTGQSTQQNGTPAPQQNGVVA